MTFEKEARKEGAIPDERKVKTSGFNRIQRRLSIFKRRGTMSFQADEAAQGKTMGKEKQAENCP